MSDDDGIKVIYDGSGSMANTSPRQYRAMQAWRFADQLGVDREELRAAADAVWSNMNQMSTGYDRALSIAGVALLAAQRERETTRDDHS